MDSSQFDYIPDKEFRRYVSNAYDAVKELGLIDFFLNEEPPADNGYLWWDRPEISMIASKVDSDGHSGASFAITLRQLKRHVKNINRVEWV